MTPQEQQMLNDLLNRIAGTPAPVRDSEADSMIQRSLGARPDALYILTQLVLVQEMGLKHAQQQIQDLQQQAARPAQAPSSFTGGPWGTSANAQQNYSSPQYPPQFSSFLHNALTTASGVIAGEMAFSALRSLFGGFGGGSSAWGAPLNTGSSFLSGAQNPGTTIVNNYYGDSNTDVADSDDGSNTDDLVATDDSSDSFSDNSDFS